MVQVYITPIPTVIPVPTSAQLLSAHCRPVVPALVLDPSLFPYPSLAAIGHIVQTDSILGTLTRSHQSSWCRRTMVLGLWRLATIATSLRDSEAGADADADAAAAR